MWFIDVVTSTFFGKQCAEVPHGQKKSGKTKKNEKSQVKMGVFEKHQILLV